MVFVYLLMLMIFLILIYDYRKQKKFSELHRKVGVDILNLPLVGHSYKFIRNCEERMKFCDYLGRKGYVNKHGIASIWLGHIFILSISDPEPAKIILKCCFDKGFVVNIAKHLFGNGSIFSPYEMWKPRRKLNLNAFTNKILNNYIRIFERKSKVMVNEMEGLIGKNISIRKFFNTYSLDVACISSLGVDLNLQQSLDHCFVESIREYSENITARLLQPWLHVDKIYELLPIHKRQNELKKVIWDFCDQLIMNMKSSRETREDPENMNCRMNIKDFKHFAEIFIELSEKKDGYSDTELREEILSLILAATDTTATTGSFTSVLLSQHQDVQKKVFEELRKTFGDTEKPVGVEDLNKLEYLEAFIKETLRLYPSIPGILRKHTEDVELPSGITIRKGSQTYINIKSIHRNPKYWGQDAEEFKPERFLNAAPKQLVAFMPFSYGPRNCLGYRFAMLSLKTNLATMLRRYRLLPATTFKYDKNNPLRVEYKVALNHIDNFVLKLERRC